MKFLLDQHELVAGFVAAMIPRVRARGFGNCRAIGIVDDNNELVAGLVYHNFQPPEDDEEGVIEMSGAALPGRQWATRETLKIMFQYPFLQLGAQMVVMRVSDRDERLLRQLAALNFRFIRVPRLFGRHEHGVLCELWDDEWAKSKICRRINRPVERDVIDIQSKEAA